jgi:hypothetical protein
MTRACTSCQHLKRAEIDRRLAAGEPVAQVARDYELNRSSLHRHRANCLGLASSSAIKKEAARGTAAVALLPSKENLASAYTALPGRIDEIVAQAQQQGSLNVAISGLNSIRQTLDSLARLAGHLQPAGTHVNVAVQTNVNVDVARIAERLIQEFDHEPELKARPKNKKRKILNQCSYPLAAKCCAAIMNYWKRLISGFLGGCDRILSHWLACWCAW